MLWVLVYLTLGVITTELCDASEHPRRIVLTSLFWPVIWILAICMIIRDKNKKG